METVSVLARLLMLFWFVEGHGHSRCNALRLHRISRRLRPASNEMDRLLLFVRARSNTVQMHRAREGTFGIIVRFSSFVPFLTSFFVFLHDEPHISGPLSPHYLSLSLSLSLPLVPFMLSLPLLLSVLAAVTTVTSFSPSPSSPVLPPSFSLAAQTGSRRSFVAAASAASSFLLLPLSPSLAADDTASLITSLKNSKALLAPLPSELASENWDKTRSVLKGAGVGELWNLGASKNPVGKLAKITDNMALIELSDELQLSLQVSLPELRERFREPPPLPRLRPDSPLSRS